ncbi:Pentatricopeptide repeat superfamily protein [Rhynchospora pubera]|uniref:Pentatricopeptide repeat superfamily protein n=1 Tax=Rhynchospora pubera TaxID=906938 RepID=A0AAV8HFN5_9POAL|nr:Pentatricopeptide repeat superfamily protein [Rhynchospora pubera]
MSSRYEYQRSLPSICTLLRRSRRSLGHLRQLHCFLLRRSLFPQPQQPLLLSHFLSLSLSLSPLPSPYSLSLLSALPSPTPLLLFNSLLSSLSHLPSSLTVFNLLRSLSPHPPDFFSLPPLIRLCAHHPAFHTGASLHALAIRLRLDSDVFVSTAFIHFYGRCLLITSARSLFDTMSRPSAVSWTALISGYLRLKDLKSAQELFDQMPERNAVTWNVMIDGYVKNADLDGARRLFDEMPEKNSVACTCLIYGFAKAGDMGSARLLFDQMNHRDRDVFAWSTMISGYAQNGCPCDALFIFNEFHKTKRKPDECIVVGLMSACSQLGNLSLAKWIDSYVMTRSINTNNSRVLTSLIDMNAKCGDMERAHFLFHSIPQRNIASYCSLMQGYCLHGLGSKAVDLFSHMIQEGLNPDEVAFTVVLSACSQAGLVEEGKKYFNMMRNICNISPSGDHYACLVDLLGRAGKLEEAYELIKLLPVEPHAGAWGALLGACRWHSNIELGELVAKRLFELEPQNGGNYVALSNIYANANRWGEVSEVRCMMNDKGVRKVPGCTWIMT